eukprot:5473834-Amphidinium_carterae.1
MSLPRAMLGTDWKPQRTCAQPLQTVCYKTTICYWRLKKQHVLQYTRLKISYKLATPKTTGVVIMQNGKQRLLQPQIIQNWTTTERSERALLHLSSGHIGEPLDTLAKGVSPPHTDPLIIDCLCTLFCTHVDSTRASNSCNK